MKKLLKKISLFFLSFLILISSYLTILAPSAHAQSTSPWYSQNPFEWYIKVYDQSTSPPNEIFGERYTAAQVQWVIWSLLTMPVRLVEAVPGIGEKGILCIFKRIGINTIDVSDCLGAIKENLTELIEFIFPKIQASNNKPFLALVFDGAGREISGIRYTKDLIKKFNPITEVRAESYGFTGLSWIQKYWKGFRDISYVLLVLVVIIFAFMIMFRVKLNPQTVISVQSALPKIVIALILITFSYAIAGFAIDLMYVISGLFALLLNLAKFSGSNLTATYGVIAGTGYGYAFLGGLWILFNMLVYAIMFFVAALLALVTTVFTALNIFGAILAIIFMVIGVLCLLIMIWYTFKIPYILLKTLISLYISIITAPIQILAGTIIPSMGFGAWFKGVMADILVFPVTGLLVWFSWSTLWSSYTAMGVDWSTSVFDFIKYGEPSWIPGIIGTTANPGVHGISAIIFLGISFGIILLIPKVPNLIKSFMSGEKFAGTGIGEAMGPVAQGYMGYAAKEFELGRTPRPLGGIGPIRRLGAGPKAGIATLLEAIRKGMA